jgi:hypothetical protein
MWSDESREKLKLVCQAVVSEVTRGSTRTLTDDEYLNRAIKRFQAALRQQSPEREFSLDGWFQRNRALLIQQTRTTVKLAHDAMRLANER